MPNVSYVALNDLHRGRLASVRDAEARVWMQDSVPPTTSYAERPGRWVAETSWPSPRIELQTPAPRPGSPRPRR